MKKNAASLSRRLRLATACVLFAASLSLVSCAGKFNADWNKAASAQKTQAPKGIEGAWDGSWVSSSNGHKGRLRCLVEPGASPKEYRFRYHATWAGFLSGGYTADTLVTPASGGGYALSSAQDLGPFGHFEQKGKAGRHRMESHYTSSLGDQGTFTLHRP